METEDLIGDKGEPDMGDIPELGNEPDAVDDDVEMEDDEDLDFLFGRSEGDGEHTPRGATMRAWECQRLQRATPPSWQLYMPDQCKRRSPGST